MLPAHLKFDLNVDTFLDHLSKAAYEVAAQRGFSGERKGLYQDLKEGLKEVICKDMFLTDQCGLFTVCEEATRYQPWSQEATEAEQEMAR